MIQFKHPEILWALFLLIVPLIVHLFHLRKFKKTAFTNVAVLKHIKISTRKSSQLKKWLLLFTRFGILTSIILAFAQPFIPNDKDFNKAQELVIYLDNSFSMQAKGSNGSLLNEAKQELLNAIPNTERFSLFTNDKSFKDMTKSSIIPEIIDLGFSSNQMDINEVYLKGKSFFTNSQSTRKYLICISDFQEHVSSKPISTDSLISFSTVQLKPQSTNNIAIDSIFFKEESGKTELNVKLTNYGDPKDNVAVSLYNNNELITKSSTSITDMAVVEFSLNTDEVFLGKLDITDNGLSYDNRLYFNIGSIPKINVLSISDINDRYLSKIYTADEFNFQSQSIAELQYTKIPEQNLIVLNHLENIPDALVTVLQDYYVNGGSLIIIPSKQGDLQSYNTLLSRVNHPSYTSLSSELKYLTEIKFEHPILKEAFYSEVRNFQYPEVKTYFKRSSDINSIYNLEDGSSLLIGARRCFSFSADITNENSNFINSPLIVPALYNIGLRSLRPDKLYYIIGQNNKIILKSDIAKDAVISLENSISTFIPRQRRFGKYLEIETIEEPSTDGHYNLVHQQDSIKTLSFNYLRDESNLNYQLPIANELVTNWSSFSELFSELKSISNVKLLWKWFAIFALVLLLLEMLIIKYFK